MRLFLGLGLPSAHRSALSALQARLGQGRPVDPEDLHVTLVFLDEVSRPQAEELDDELSSMTLRLGPLTLTGVACFGSAAPRLAYVGVHDDGLLADLQARLERRARRLGLAPPKRRFVPHVTIARFGAGAVDEPRLAAFLAGAQTLGLPPFQPEEVTLYQSHPGRTPPIYEALAGYPITPGPTT